MVAHKLLIRENISSKSSNKQMIQLILFETTWVKNNDLFLMVISLLFHKHVLWGEKL